MDITEIAQSIFDKAKDGARYKRTRGPAGKQVHDVGKRIRLGDGVVARCYTRDNDEVFYEVYERNQLVFQLRVKGETWYNSVPIPGKWVYKLGVKNEIDEEELDIDEAPDVDEDPKVDLAGRILKQAQMLAMRGTHFDESKGATRAIGRTYKSDGIEVTLRRTEKNGEPTKQSRSFLTIQYGTKLVFSAELTNNVQENKERAQYNGEATWVEEFLNIK